MICPKCGNPVLDTNFFCAFCGKQIKDKPLSTSFFKQSGLYLFAFFFPPFGIVPAIKYLKNPDDKAKIVGSVIIVVTVVSLIVTVWATMQFVNNFNQTLKAQLQLQQNTIYP